LPWPLAKGNGFILVWESLTGIISPQIPRTPRRSLEWGELMYGGFRFGPDMSTSELLPFKMASEKKIEEPGV
jgi:hypothetical protein